jgi:hypothetical protein
MIVSVGSHLQRMRGIHWFHSAIASSDHGGDPKLSALKIFNSPPVPTFCLDLIWRPSPACDPLIVVSFVVADVTCDDIAAS